MPGVEVVAVALVALDGDVAFARVGVDEDDGCFGGGGCGRSRSGVVGGAGDDLGAVGCSTFLDGVEGPDEILSCQYVVREKPRGNLRETRRSHFPSPLRACHCCSRGQSRRWVRQG